MTNYYSILGVREGASKAEIKSAYRRLVMQWHPDKNPSPGAKQKFIAITEAYEALMEGKEEPKIEFRFHTEPKKTQTDKRQEELRERMRKYAQQRQEQFQYERAKYRKSQFYKIYFYGEAWLNLLLVPGVLVIPIVLAFIKGNASWLLAEIFAVGIAASFYYKGIRLKKKADMIYGERSSFSLRELESIYFWKPKDNSYDPGNMQFPWS